MADDTVQQIVNSSASASVNSHPSLIQRRSRRRESNEEKKQGRRAYDREEREEKRGPVFRDTVTITAAKESAGQDTGSLKPVSTPEDTVRKAIDIRI